MNIENEQCVQETEKTGDGFICDYMTLVAGDMVLYVNGAIRPQ